ncbi:MAG: FHA domain-containing protein [Polyangiaceae bacterium]
MASGSETRAVAGRVAKILRDRGRNEEALVILCAAAAAFGNDAEGQGLLADALRIDQNSALARMTFERMEGVAGNHAELDAAITRYTHEELSKLERTLRPGVFLRAQVGFNNNIKYKGAEYHVQTEDSGLDKPHIITHLFADGGRIIKSHKRSYASETARTDVSQYVRGLMKGQHMEMVLMLREGKFDDIIAGRASGGVETLEKPPEVDLDRIGSQQREKRAAAGTPARGVPPARESSPRAVAVPAEAPRVVAPAPVPPTAESPRPASQPTTPIAVRTDGSAPVGPGQAFRQLAPRVGLPPVAARELRARLHVTRSLQGGPEFYEVRGDEAVLGTGGTVKLEGERFCHPREAMLTWETKSGAKGGTLILADLDGGNGVFLRIHRRVEIGLNDEFIIGDQLLRLERNPDPNDGPGAGPTYFRSSLKWPSAFRVVQVFEGGAPGAVSMARGTTLQIGSALDYANDMVFRGDPLISPYHCVIEEQADSFILTDLGARSGVFVRVHGKHRLAHGSELLVGRTRLMVDMSPSDGSVEPLG